MVLNYKKASFHKEADEYMVLLLDTCSLAIK